MRLNWISALPTTPRSDTPTDECCVGDAGLAAYVATVIPMLADRADIHLWVNDVAAVEAMVGSELLHHVVEVHPIADPITGNRTPWVELNRGDMTVYHVGRRPNSAAVLELSRHHSGVVVIHDELLLEPYVALAQVDRVAARELTQLLDHDDALQGRAVADGLIAGRRDARSVSERYPVTSVALTGALGVLVHDVALRDRLQPTVACPVRFAPMPFTPSIEQTSAEVAPPPRRSEPWRIVIVCEPGSGRTLEVVLGAIEGLPRDVRYQLIIDGDPWHWSYAARRRVELHLTDIIDLSAPMDHLHLGDALATAHIGVHLRPHCGDEGRWHQLRLFEHACPSIVLNTGWLATLPTTAVEYVNPDNETTDLKNAIRRLLDSPWRRAAMAAAARAELVTQHSPGRYAVALLSLIDAACNYRPRSLVVELAADIARDIDSWSGARVLGVGESIAPAKPAGVALNSLQGRVVGPVSRSIERHLEATRTVGAALLTAVDSIPRLDATAADLPRSTGVDDGD